MTRPFRFLVLALYAAALAACAALPSASAPPAPGPQPINPGDRVGDILFTTAPAADTDFVWELKCSPEGAEGKYRCTAKVGNKVNISAGVYPWKTDASLDELWAGHTYEMLVGDRSVNLKAFGSVDETHPRVGPMRHWNVVLVASTPGEITVHDKGKVGENAFDEVTTYVFESE